MQNTYSILDILCEWSDENRYMMMSSNGNIFRVTGPLCLEFTGHRWIPLTKTSDAELWCFLWSAPWINGWVNNREAADLRRHLRGFAFSAMIFSFEWHFNVRALTNGFMGRFILPCWHPYVVDVSVPLITCVHNSTSGTLEACNCQTSSI